MSNRMLPVELEKARLTFSDSKYTWVLSLSDPTGAELSRRFGGTYSGGRWQLASQPRLLALLHLWTKEGCERDDIIEAAEWLEDHDVVPAPLNLRGAEAKWQRATTKKKKKRTTRKERRSRFAKKIMERDAAREPGDRQRLVIARRELSDED